MTTQPQLFGIALAPNDVYYTPDWVARDMVAWFNPTGRILEPCRGDDAIYRYLPAGSDWCEIERGRDFFSWSKPVDWIISNPPYSIFDEWMRHSYDIAADIVYLLASGKLFTASGRLQRLNQGGWIKHIRFYGTGSSMGFPNGNMMAAIHFQRGYHGDTSWSWYAARDAAGSEDG